MIDKKKIAMFVVCLVLLAGAFAAGRFTATVNTEEKIKTVEVVKTVEVEKKVVEYVDRVVEKKIYVAKLQKDVVKTTEIKQNKDGTTTTVVTEVDKSKLEEASSQETSKDTSIVSRETKTNTTDDIKSIDSFRKTESLAQWRLSLRGEVGATVSKIQPLLGVGVSAERRIIGPFWAGLSASTDFSFNLTGFQGLNSVKGGIHLSVEF